jgi:hypothetical protein
VEKCRANNDGHVVVTLCTASLKVNQAREDFGALQRNARASDSPGAAGDHVGAFAPQPARRCGSYALRETIAGVFGGRLNAKSMTGSYWG